MYLCLNEFEVRGILDGTITELWRPVKPRPDYRHHKLDFEDGVLKESSLINGCWHVEKKIKSPFGPVGTRITGREVWATNGWFDGKKQCVYKADVDECGRIVNENLDESDIKWRSPICLPAELSRLTLINTGVECKPINKITVDEVIHAGIPEEILNEYGLPVRWFQLYWDSLYAKKGDPFKSAYGWKLKFEVEVRKQWKLYL